MRVIPVSQFKVNMPKIIDQISKDHVTTMVITKRGKPVAKVIPYHEAERSTQPDQLAGTVEFMEDIVAPLGEEMWQVCS